MCCKKYWKAGDVWKQLNFSEHHKVNMCDTSAVCKLEIIVYYTQKYLPPWLHIVVVCFTKVDFRFTQIWPKYVPIILIHFCRLCKLYTCTTLSFYSSHEAKEDCVRGSVVIVADLKSGYFDHETDGMPTTNRAKLEDLEKILDTRLDLQELEFMYSWHSHIS